jgi:glucose-1-phosphate adenylyltransferase
MRLDDTGRVAGFLEKPKTEEEVRLVRTDPAWIDARGIASRGRDCLANMGIYLFKRDALVDVLEKTDYRDFGKEVFPASIRSRHVQVYLFDDYWEDIGTIGSFYRANLDLTRPDAPFDLASVEAPIYSHARFLPPTRVDGATIRGSLVADGSAIAPGAVIENSVIGVRCRIGRDVVIRDSVVMGADFYETPADIAASEDNGHPPLGIGEGSHIEGAIVDKNCRIGRQVRVVNERGIENTEETPHGMIRDGVVVLAKGTPLPDGWRMK